MTSKNRPNGASSDKPAATPEADKPFDLAAYLVKLDRKLDERFAAIDARIDEVSNGASSPAEPSDPYAPVNGTEPAAPVVREWLRLVAKVNPSNTRLSFDHRNQYRRHYGLPLLDSHGKELPADVTSTGTTEPWMAQTLQASKPAVPAGLPDLSRFVTVTRTVADGAAEAKAEDQRLFDVIMAHQNGAAMFLTLSRINVVNRDSKVPAGTMLATNGFVHLPNVTVLGGHKQVCRRIAEFLVYRAWQRNGSPVLESKSLYARLVNGYQGLLANLAATGNVPEANGYTKRDRAMAVNYLAHLRESGVNVSKLIGL